MDHLPASQHLPNVACKFRVTGHGLVTYVVRALLMILLIRGRVTMAADLTYIVQEELAPGSHVGNLAEDTDLEQYVSADSFNTLRYTFLAGETAYTSLFRLDESTGDLSTSIFGRLDREAVCQFQTQCILSLQVAIQSTLNQFFRKVSVDVNVTDINDNAPTFPSNWTVMVISESVQIPSMFPLISALDPDTGANNSLKGYEIVPKDGPFGIALAANSQNLMLVVKQELDHERKSTYQLQVIARDGGKPPLQGILVINVNVGDENDNEPKFTEEFYSTTVDEDVMRGTVLLTITATDLDANGNGEVRYRLSSQQSQIVTSMFAVDPITGELSVSGDIENGQRDKYEIVVEASDMGAQPFTTSTTVTVNVRDTINSPPKLTISLLTGNGFSTISEYASLGAVVAHIAVKDGDGGRNGIVQCELDHHAYFSLQSFDVNEYKVIVARALDRETIAAHNVTVLCIDAGVHPLTATAKFEIRVTDENDNSPMFVQKEYRTSVAENSVHGLAVLTVLATDPDAGDNGKVSYSLHPNARGRFLVSPDTGVIITNDDFDYELEIGFNFTVLASDAGDPPRSDSVTVFVFITDVNDQKPSFARDVFPFSVSEQTKLWTSVGRVTANDFERGVNGEVEIMADRSAMSGVPFSVQTNGSIILTGPLDHEHRIFYTFRVIARDKGYPPLNDTAEVQISVLDENDNRPRVTYPNGTELVLYISMDDDISRPVAKIQAEDPDSGLNGQLQFIITSRNDSSRFDVDANSGEVFITRTLRRTDINTYRLQVLIQDSGTPPLAADRTLIVWVHAGNGTGSFTSGPMNDQYILITLAIVCITVILSAVIVLIIVILKRMDRRRKPNGDSMHIQNSRVLGSYVDRVKADNLHNETMDGGISEKEYGGGGFETFGKGVSEDGEFGFSHTGGCKLEGGNGIDSNSLKLSSDDKFKSPLSSSYASNPSQHPVTASQDSDLDLEALQIHQVLLKSYQDASLSACDPWDDEPPGQEDFQSDSSEETIPSDSGRGGSEEDLSHSGSTGQALNDDARLAAIHDVSFQSSSTGTVPRTISQRLAHQSSSSQCKSNVRDPVRTSGRKHVTFKDLSASKRGFESLRASTRLEPLRATTGLTPTGTSMDLPQEYSTHLGPQSCRSAPGSGAEGEGDSSRHFQSTMDCVKTPMISFGTADKQLGAKSSPQTYQAPKDFYTFSIAEYSRGVDMTKTSQQLGLPKNVNLGQAKPPCSSELPKVGETLRESPKNIQFNCTEMSRESPKNILLHAGESPRNASSTFLRDWNQIPQLELDSFYKGKNLCNQVPRSSFKQCQEMQTFHPACRVSNQSTESPSQHNFLVQKDTLTLSRDRVNMKDSRNDSTDDYDDQRSTTTSGSYTIDNEDTYTGLDTGRSPWKDVVV